MAMVWFGWAQEDPPPAWRAWLGAGSVLGIAVAGLFGYGVFLRWNDGSALEGQYHWFGVLTGLEVIAAGLGCLYLTRSQRSRWMAWWVAIVVAVHFVPLAYFLRDASLVVLGLLQLGALLAIRPRLRQGNAPTSTFAGPVMGLILLAFALVSVVVFVACHGSLW